MSLLRFPDTVCRARSASRTSTLSLERLDLVGVVVTTSTMLARWWLSLAAVGALARAHTWKAHNSVVMRTDGWHLVGQRVDSANFVVAPSEQSARAVANPAEVCRLLPLPDPGPCAGRKKRYYFSSRAGECRPFFFGGCGGNANRFETIQVRFARYKAWA